ncbi:lactose permease [Citrobacter koseri]|uniref:Lactose permease n=1 Tax=Citrobacter koseri TaxID=545 RepID=A0A2X2UWH4_CITKO|nr:lactose permease [Citrobacter koseri]
MAWKSARCLPVNGVFAVIIKPVYGYIMDKMGMKKHLLYFVCIVSALMAPFYIWCYLPLLQTHFVSGMNCRRAVFQPRLVCGRGGRRVVC